MHKNDIELELLEVFFMWTEVYSPQNPDFEKTHDFNASDSDIAYDSMQINNNFDYEISPNKEWHFYHYLGMRLPHLARVMVRMDYLITGEEPSWSTLFDYNNIQAVVALSIDRTLEAFKEFCKLNNVDLSPQFKIEPDVLKEMEATLSQGMVDTYINHRRCHDIECFEAENTIALQCPQSDKIRITLLVSFMVIDEILFNNIGFKRIHNRDVFYEKVPECRYYTLKMKCLQISNHPVDLTSLDVQLFLVIVDCSIQMLLGDKSDFLLPALEKRGVTDEVRSLFFKSTTELFTIYRDYPIAPAPTDWNSLIR